MFENSYKTAIVRKGISQPVKKLLRYGTIRRVAMDERRDSVLDYGCGKGADAEYLRCDKFDPHYFPSETMNPDGYESIICTYVFNVVSEEDQEKIIRNIIKLLRNENSFLYVSVRMDIPVEGTRTQRWVELGLPFRNYYNSSKYRIYYASKHDLLESEARKAAEAKQG